MQDVHYLYDRYLVASTIEEKGDYSVTEFLVRDSLVFDFGNNICLKTIVTERSRLLGIVVFCALTIKSTAYSTQLNKEIAIQCD